MDIGILAVTSLRLTLLPWELSLGLPPGCPPARKLLSAFVPGQGDGHFPWPAPSPSFLQASCGASCLLPPEAPGALGRPARLAPGSPRGDCISVLRDLSSDTSMAQTAAHPSPLRGCGVGGRRVRWAAPTPSHSPALRLAAPHLEMDSSRCRAFRSSSCICFLMSSSPSEAEDGVPSSSQRSRSALDWGSGHQGQSRGQGWGRGQVRV